MKAKEFNCKTCNFKSTGPTALGNHYNENPSHRPAHHLRGLVMQAKPVPRVAPRTNGTNGKHIAVTALDQVMALKGNFEREIESETGVIESLKVQLRQHEMKLVELHNAVSVISQIQSTKDASLGEVQHQHQEALVS